MLGFEKNTRTGGSAHACHTCTGGEALHALVNCHACLHTLAPVYTHRRLPTRLPHLSHPRPRASPRPVHGCLERGAQGVRPRKRAGALDPRPRRALTPAPTH